MNPARLRALPRASNACSTETISEEECLEAVVGLLPDGQVQGIRKLGTRSSCMPGTCEDFSNDYKCHCPDSLCQRNRAWVLWRELTEE